MSHPVWPGVIEYYREFLPVGEDTPVVTLQEGNTPLVPAPALAKRISCPLPIFLKCEGFNPTGSFKDRGMTVAVSKAKEEGAKAILCASTGNTAASAAAYGARAGLDCVILIGQATVAAGKLAQSVMHGAKVLSLRGNFDDCLRLARTLTERYPIALVNSLNPNRIEGQKTGAFEICDVLGDAPAYHPMPVGNAGNITAYWKGYKEYREAGKTTRLPKVLGFEAEGAAPIVKGHPIPDPKTIASAIRIGNPASWKKAEEARDESGGLIGAVSDDEIIEMYQVLAQKEGIFVEPSSAAGVAGVARLVREGYFDDAPRGSVIVCVLTGHGLKDPERAMAVAPEPPVLPADAEAIAAHLGL